MSEVCKTMSMERKRGFTIIELLITIVVATILLAIGVPSFQEFIKNNRISGQSNSLIISIQMARNEAIKRGTGSVLCASTDQATCSGNDDWSTGWIVYSDVGQDGNLDLDANGDGVEDCVRDDCLVRTSNALTKSTLDGNGRSSIRFLPTGLTTNVAAVTLKLTADDCYHKQVRDVTITRQGHTMVTKQDCP